MTIKKMTSRLLVIAAASLALTGCAKKVTINAIVDGIGDYDIVSMPTNTVNGTINEDVLTITVKKDGDYSFVLKGEDGNEHTVTIKYYNGEVSADTEDGVTVNLGVGEIPTIPADVAEMESEINGN